MKLQNKIAFITGGGRGIGREIALAFAREGADVAVAARTTAEVEAVAKEVQGLGRRGLAVRLDLANRANIRQAVKTVLERFGRIDILVNNAGVLSKGPVLSLAEETWDTTLAINLTGMFLVTQSVLGQMLERKWGRIINVNSSSGKIGLPYRSAYAASKHGALGFVRSLANEVADKGITVNAICPGLVETPMWDTSVENFAAEMGKTTEEAREMFRQRIPVKRFTEAWELAPLAVYLASDDAISMTGQAIQLDGGFLQG
ncbi:MAG: SDR family oxidoreductase [Candidatus Tectomicrobia bacterium]|nr:SDR family oxidoreductase [Candidatus Tectomicrobia bacterium]